MNFLYAHYNKVAPRDKHSVWLSTLDCEKTNVSINCLRHAARNKWCNEFSSTSTDIKVVLPLNVTLIVNMGKNVNFVCTSYE